MKDLFPGYYSNTAEEVSLTTTPTLVAFDANVLLNLYRYPISASEDILRLMEGLTDQVWLPYHAALEYQRNRLLVVADQKKRFREARSAVEKGVASLKGELDKLQLVKRHSTINITTLLSELQTAQQKFLQTLAQQETAQRDVNDADPTRTRLEGIFAGRIGNAPDQEWIDKAEKEGKARFDAKCPPGYCDQAKEGETFRHQGNTYRREFGDLFLWKQLLAHAKGKSIKQLVFVTDDDKEDWWYLVESGGPKRIGPRPELTEEIKREAGVEKFIMLSSERFAPLFSHLLNIPLRANTIEQVEDVKSTLSETVSVSCPSCRAAAMIQLGRFIGSSAMHFCTACKTRFHIHRGPDGQAFTREWGSSRESVHFAGRPASHRVIATCPKCNESVPANIRDDEASTQRYCMNCCSLLTIDQTGQVLTSETSAPVAGAEVTTEGRFSFVSCPTCPEVPPLRPIWGEGSVVRAVCPSCEKLIEGRRADI